MTAVVLDSSVTLSWCFTDESSAYGDQVFVDILGSGALVPPLWPYEVANALAMGWQRGRITPREIGEFLDVLGDLAIAVAEQPTIADIGRLVQLAQASRLTAYDAAYLDLASRAALPLATIDAALSAAATAAGVSLFPAS